MSDIAIRVENLSKMYRIGRARQRHDTLRDALVVGLRLPLGWLRGDGRAGDGAPEDTIWALKDVSFEVEHGEVVGIIGRNGAGKSTLLKILSRITEPTEGRAEIHGRVGSLLEVGTGFHPELTGRENVYLSGAILGMRRAEIDAKFDEIVAFAEVDKFLDTPFKHYSSGMKVRLGFAVAAHLEPEILLVDEVLAVGDAAFQKKCLGKMGEVAGKGRTVLFVSHNMAAVSALCPTTIYLERGSIGKLGLTDEIIGQYLAGLSDVPQLSLSERTDRVGDGRTKITSIRFLDGRSLMPLDTVLSGQEVYIEVSYESSQCSGSRLSAFNIGLAFFNSLGQFVMVLNSEMANRAFELLPLEGRVFCWIPRFPLMGGAFQITATLQVNRVLADQVRNAIRVYVETGDYFGTGIPNDYGRQGVYVDHRWVTNIG